MPPKVTKPAIQDMVPSDSFILSDNPKNGVVLREVWSDSRGTSGQLVELSEAQLVSSALNETARKYGEGKFFWIPSRRTRALAKDEGYCRTGGDVVMIPYVWTSRDEQIWDEATPFERLRLTNAWTCLPGRTIVICIFVQHKAKPKSEYICPLQSFCALFREHLSDFGDFLLTFLSGATFLPQTQHSDGRQSTKFEFGTASVLLLWDDFPNMAFKEHFKRINLDASTPTVTEKNCRAHRVHSLKAVVEKALQVWSYRTSDGRYSKRVSMEEVYADALTLGPRKDETLSKITWRRT